MCGRSARRSSKCPGGELYPNCRRSGLAPRSATQRPDPRVLRLLQHDLLRHGARPGAARCHRTVPARTECRRQQAAGSSEVGTGLGVRVPRASAQRAGLERTERVVVSRLSYPADRTLPQPGGGLYGESTTGTARHYVAGASWRQSQTKNA